MVDGFARHAILLFLAMRIKTSSMSLLGDVVRAEICEARGYWCGVADYLVCHIPFLAGIRFRSGNREGGSMPCCNWRAGAGSSRCYAILY